MCKCVYVYIAACYSTIGMLAQSCCHFPEMPAPLRDVLEILTTLKWVSLSPSNQDNQWCACCRSLDLIMRKHKRAELKYLLTSIKDDVGTHEDVKFVLIDTLEWF